MIFVFIFYVSWILLLIGIFILSREVLYKYTNHNNVSIFFALFVTMAFFYEAVLMHEEQKWKNDTLLSRFSNWLFPHPKSDHWRWHVNPVTVPFSLFGRIVTLAASVFGRSSGALVAHFLEELPFVVSLSALPFTMLCIVIGILAFSGYNFNLCYGFIRIDNNQDSIVKSRIKNIFESSPQIPWNTRPVSSFDFCVKKVTENYQKMIPR